MQPKLPVQLEQSSTLNGSLEIILNEGKYRINKLEVQNFAKKENFGTDKKSNKIQAKIQDKLYLQDLFGNSGYNDWFKWTKEKTFILN